MNSEHNQLLKAYFDATHQHEQSIREGKVTGPLEESLEKGLSVVLEEIARLGKGEHLHWPLLRHFLAVRMQTCLESMPNKSPGYADQKEVLLMYLFEFTEVGPFTLQRLCELVLKPETYYSCPRKLLYAFEKLVSVSQP